MPLSDLSSEQQQAFQDRLQDMKLDQSKVAPKICSSLKTGPTILSADPAESAIPPEIFTFSDLDQMKSLIGNPDADYENGVMDMHHEILPEWPEEKNGKSPEELEPDENRNIEHAFNAYLFGHSGYFSSYKKVIEAHKFPLKFLVFAAEDVCLDASNSPLLIKTGSGMNFGTVTICEGGSIEFEADAVMFVQKMVKVTASSCSEL